MFEFQGNELDKTWGNEYDELDLKHFMFTSDPEETLKYSYNKL